MQWERLEEPLPPAGRETGRPRKWSRRRLLDGIRRRTRTGAPWRDGDATDSSSRPSY
ncbi:transposase [Streptomyces sp. NPDC048305]|uniref:transposase n=1 Tax=Streptomyces sp. NPDC048305 TaxID=3365532 RepID=UPI0037246673